MTTDIARQRLVDLLRDERYGDVAHMLEEAELEQGTVGRDWPWVQLVLGHIHNDDLEFARFAYKRAPQDLGAELDAAVHLLKLLWHRDFPAVWPQLDGMSKQGVWSMESSVLVGAISSRLRARILSLISRAYQKVSVRNAAALAGLSEADMVSEASRLGWELDASTAMLTVHRQEAKADSKLDLSMLENLSKQMIALDN